MSKELEIAAAVAAGGLAADIARKQTHAECLNCGAALQGPWCHACGQRADDHHRSIARLIWEAIEGVTHLDGRVARTLPALIFRPGRLAKDYVDGRLTRHIPPFRLFLVSLLIFMLSLEFIVFRIGGYGVHAPPKARGAPSALNSSIEIDEEPDAKSGAAGQKQRFTINRTGADIEVTAPSARPGAAANTSKVAVTPGAAELGVLDREKPTSAFAVWLRDHLKRAVANPEFYITLVFEWAHRLAFLMLPILAAQLTLLYFYRRRFFVYDHLIVAMQYLSFCFLLWATVWVLPQPVQEILFLPALVWTPVNLFLTLRGAYGSSIWGAGLKALLLWISTLIVFCLLIVGLLVIALGQI
jgi:hypothetical protein